MVVMTGPNVKFAAAVNACGQSGEIYPLPQHPSSARRTLADPTLASVFPATKAGSGFCLCYFNMIYDRQAARGIAHAMTRRSGRVIPPTPTPVQVRPIVSLFRPIRLRRANFPAPAANPPPVAPATRPHSKPMVMQQKKKKPGQTTGPLISVVRRQCSLASTSPMEASTSLPRSAAVICLPIRSPATATATLTALSRTSRTAAASAEAIWSCAA